MANYLQAFTNVFSLDAPESLLRGERICLESLGCWQSMEAIGFSKRELYRLFKREYGAELWAMIAGDELHDQYVANLLFKSAAQGYLEAILLELQKLLHIPPSGVMCSDSVHFINLLPRALLLNWLGPLLIESDDNPYLPVFIGNQTSFTSLLVH